jgi:hypothetical protein
MGWSDPAAVRLERAPSRGAPAKESLKVNLKFASGASRDRDWHLYQLGVPCDLLQLANSDRDFQFENQVQFNLKIRPLCLRVHIIHHCPLNSPPLSWSYGKLIFFTTSNHLIGCTLVLPSSNSKSDFFQEAKCNNLKAHCCVSPTDALKPERLTPHILRGSWTQ